MKISKFLPNKHAIVCLINATLILLMLTVCLISTACKNTEDNNESQQTVFEDEEQLNKSLKNVVVFGTGGTIAGKGESGKTTGYKSGDALSSEIIDAVPEIKNIANVQCIQLFNIPSDDISGDNLIMMAKKINEMEKNQNVDGFVIMHGTDTMEETAYFLNLVCKTEKPVILTGAMRPATAISADGPSNLYQAILLAASDEAKNKPVLAVMNDTILSSRDFQKTSTSKTSAMQSGDLGAVGFIEDNHVIFRQNNFEYKFKNSSQFSIDNVEKLPNVCVLYFNIDADVDMLKYALGKYDGVVIAGAGAGGYDVK